MATGSTIGEDADQPMVRIRGLRKSYGEHVVLHDIDMDIARGEVVVVAGPSGSGKSTLCRCINRLEVADAGDISVAGRPVPLEGRELARLRAEVGMVFQQFNLFAHKTVLQNVTLAPVKVLGRPAEQARERAMELLDRVGVAAHAAKFPAQLSGGQQQRVAMGGALAMDPKRMLF
jgi:glutamate transport system ATP-binding protein